MIDYLGMVKNFHKAFHLPIGNQPQLLNNQEQFANRLRLIIEELSEYCEAVAKKDVVDMADGLADLLWVVFGTAVEHGLPMNQIFKEVAASNMSKVDGYKDSSGKWIKPDTYKPVDLSWLLESEETK